MDHPYNDELPQGPILTAFDKYLQQAKERHEQTVACLSGIPYAIAELAFVSRSCPGSMYQRRTRKCIKTLKMVNCMFVAILYQIFQVPYLLDAAMSEKKLLQGICKQINVKVKFAVKSVQQLSEYTDEMLVGSHYWPHTFFDRSSDILQGSTSAFSAFEQKEDAKQVRYVLAQMAVIRITTLLSTYVEIHETELLNLLRNFGTEDLDSFSERCEEAAANISRIIESSNASLAKQLEELLTLLAKEEHIDDAEESDTIVVEMIKDEQAQEAAAHQEKLERLLLAAPLSVVLLAQLCGISTTTMDFKMQIPLVGFKYVKSEWFRTGLHQVVNSGAASFSLAHKNMTKIESHSRGIPVTVLEVLRILLFGTREDVEAMLPDKLEDVVSKANECNELAAAVENSFEYLVCLINELAQTCTATRSALEAGQTIQVSLAEVSKRLEAKREITDADIENARNALLEGMKALSKVRQQWSDLTRFFNNIARVIKLEMQEPLDSFKTIVIKKADKIVQRNKKLSEYATDIHIPS